ncbi:MAG: hypothetical protein PWP52_2229 [Bacteroidales bacterium]|nr:hypothetical protein [Bacteroidales bacterium]
MAVIILWIHSGVKDKNVMNKTWQLLTLKFDKDNLNALMLQYQAAQYIAMTGRHLIPQKPDDSNTNMQYIFDRNMLLGNLIDDKYSLGMHLIDSNLHLVDKQLNSLTTIEIVGKTKEQVFSELKEALNQQGIDVSKFSQQLHYDIPENGLDHNGLFLKPKIDYLKENTLYRHNAQIILEDLASQLKNAEHVGVWPHHFDMGTYVPLAYEKGNVSKSYGLGWAIPDRMVNEPYFYLSFWSQNKPIDFSKLPKPDAGEWIREGWNGGVLRLSDILKEKSSPAQFELVKAFFSSGLEILNKTGI